MKMLHMLLAGQFALCTRMRNCRWNATCPQSLRTLFESHHKVLDEILDDVASRARETGNCRTAAVASFFKMEQTKTQPGVHPHAAEIMAELLAGHRTVLHELRRISESCAGKRGNTPLNGLVSDMMEKHKNMAGDIRTTAEQGKQRRANLRA